MAICPKCPGKLETLDIEGVKIDHCNECEGIWFDQSELEQILKKDSFHIDSPDLNGQKFDGKEITGALKELLDSRPSHCPKCKQKPELLRIKQKKSKTEIFMDKCPVCGGIWLDGGEITILRNNFYRKISDKNVLFKHLIQLFHK
jgi:Zn-finger nucleic acid-binding protein